MRGRYQGRVVFIEQPMQKYQRPLYHGGRVIGIICSLAIVIISGVVGVLLIVFGILMIVWSEHGIEFHDCSTGVSTKKRLPHLLPGGIACLVIGVIFIILCIFLIIYMKKRYKSLTSSSSLGRHLINCTAPYRDEDQLSSGRHSRVHTAGTERTHSLAPKRWHRSSRSHTLDGPILEYPTSQNLTPVGYTNGTTRAPITYLRSNAVYPSQYPTSERQRFSYNHASNGQPYYYDFPKDELHTRRPPSPRRSTYPQSPLERPSRILLSPSEQQSRYPPPPSEVISDHRTFGEQPLHNLTGEKTSSNLRYPPSVGKSFAYYHSSNGQRLYYDFSTGEVLSQRHHTNGEAARIHSPPGPPMHDEQQPSPIALTSNNPVIDEQPANDLPEEPLSPPPPPDEQTLHISQNPEEESFRTSLFDGDPRSINTPTHDGDHSINHLAEVEASVDTTLPNEGPLPKSPSPLKETSQYVPSPDEETSENNHPPNDNPLGNTLAPVEEPSSNTPIPEKEASIDTPAPTEEPLGNIPAPDEEPSSNDPAPDAEGSNNSPVLDEEASNCSAACSDGQGSVDIPAANEEPAGSAPNPDEVLSNSIPAPDDEPSSNTPDTEKEPSSDTPATEKKPSRNTPDPDEELSSNTPAPEEEPLSNAPAHEEEPLSNEPAPEEAPLSNAPDPEEEPLSNAPAPEEEPLSNAPAPEEDPLSNAPAPEKEPLSNAPAPEEEPLSNAPAPEEEPLNNAPAPEEEPLSNAPAPEEEPLSNAPAPKEAPLSNAPDPEEEPSNKTHVPDEEPSDNSQA